MQSEGAIPIFSQGCVFCAQRGPILLRTDHMFLRLDDSPIVEGHALVCTQQHYPSFADIPNDLAPELERILHLAREVFEDAYGVCSFFEHGRTASCTVRDPNERFCYHAHLHVSPSTVDLANCAAEKLPQIEVQSWYDVIAEGKKGTYGYLYIETPRQQRYFFPIVRPIGQHFLRTCLATGVGDPSLADWTRIVGTERSLRLMEQAESKLMPRIVQAKVV